VWSRGDMLNKTQPEFRAREEMRPERGGGFDALSEPWWTMAMAVTWIIWAYRPRPAAKYAFDVIGGAIAGKPWVSMSVYRTFVDYTSAHCRGTLMHCREMGQKASLTFRLPKMTRSTRIV
jgi:hypothetical protein